MSCSKESKHRWASVCECSLPLCFVMHGQGLADAETRCGMAKPQRH